MDNLEYYCLGNDTSGYCNGCFKSVVISMQDIKEASIWNVASRKLEKAYTFKCPYCGKMTIVDSRIFEEEPVLKLEN